MKENYTIIDATIEVIIKIIKYMGKIAYRFIKWAYNEF
jgi:hypothetical protein